MCYIVVLSTDSPVDLSGENDRLIAFSRELPDRVDVDQLAYPHRWFVGSAHGCSCGFRHLHVSSIELGFAEPVDWFPEEPDDVEATRKFAAIVRRLVEQGAHVDCVDAWEHGDSRALSGIVDIDVGQVSDARFRFFENHRFVFHAPSR
jgi:hypothetical protein